MCARILQSISMENQSNSEVPKLKSLDGVISPINVPNFVCGRRFHHSPLSPILDSYASDSSDSPSPLMKYLCSPALGVFVPSSPVFATPLKVEEDVLVMDGIPVPKSNKGGRARVTRSTLTSLSLNSTSLSQPFGVGAENSSSNKADICRNWEDSGICRLGSKCLVNNLSLSKSAHGKEELRPRFSGKNKLEIFKPYISSTGSSSSSHGKKTCSVKQIIASSTAAAALSLRTPPTMASSITTLEIKPNSVFIYDSKVPNPALSCSNWSPLDDGIEVILPLGLSERKKNPSKEDLEAQIQKVLYGTGSTKRLPVFLNICTD